METLERQVRRARRRLIVQSLAGRLAWCWFFALAVATLAIAAGKFYAALDQRLWAIGWLSGAVVAGLAGAAAWTWMRRQSRLEAALELDRRFGLKERVSSALALGPLERDSEVGQALAADAEQTIRRVDVTERFSVRPDRRVLLPLVPAAAAFALAVFVPTWVPEAPAATASTERAQLKTSTRQLAKKIAQRRKEAEAKGLEELDPLLARLEQGTQDLAKASANDRKETLLALNDLAKDVEKRRQDLAGAADIKKQLANLKDLKQGPADKLAKALEEGDIAEAVKQLDKLKQALAGDKLDDKAKQALAQQLDQLREALEKQAQAREQMANKLKEQIEAERRAGNLARADQLQRQLEQLQAPRQMDALGQMQQQLAQAAQCLGQGDCENAAEALAQLGGDLAQLQENLQEMEFLEGALDQMAECKMAMACKNCDGKGCEACQGGNGNWEKQFGQLDGHRHRGGGKGIGVGLGPGLGDDTNPEGKFFDSAVKQQPGKGAAKVIGQADGPNRKGIVRQQIQTEFSSGDQNAEDALSDQRLPRDYRDHAQKYFDALRNPTH